MVVLDGSRATAADGVDHAHRTELHPWRAVRPGAEPAARVTDDGGGRMFRRRGASCAGDVAESVAVAGAGEPGRGGWKTPRRPRPRRAPRAPAGAPPRGPRLWGYSNATCSPGSMACC